MARDFSCIASNIYIHDIVLRFEITGHMCCKGSQRQEKSELGDILQGTHPTNEWNQAKFDYGMTLHPVKHSYMSVALQDLLMVIYLTQLTKTQLQLHEKLTSVSVNQLKEYQKLLPE